MYEIPVKWKFDFVQDHWSRIGLWIHVDVRSPLISLRFLWWTVGFGRMAHFEDMQAFATSPPEPDTEDFRKSLEDFRAGRWRPVEGVIEELTEKKK